MGSPDDEGDALQCARRWPKVLLHEHLDGGLREATLLDLLHARGLAAPAGDAPALRRWFAERAHAGSLAEYLRGFALTVAAMARPDALRRVAREAVEDAAADGCVLGEFRIAPLLFEAHGLSGDTAVEALLAGLEEGSRASGMPAGLIVCAMRHLPPQETRRAAALALRWQPRGVVGFDLAGAEAGHPPAQHGAALAMVREANLPLTLHAGEADEGRRVLDAVAAGARRIGHGVRLADLLGRPEGDRALGVLRERGTHLEICPTSNVHTGAAASLRDHPIGALWRAGVSLSYHTDNRLISGVTMSEEALNLAEHCGLDRPALWRMAELAAGASFLPAPHREAALSRLRDAAH